MAKLFRHGRYRNTKTTLLWMIGAVAAIVSLFQQSASSPAKRPAEPPLERPASDSRNGESIIDRAFAARQSNTQVQGQGTVFRILPDDRDGSRHQKFLVRLSSGLTILIAHNIDLAPRVENIAVNDSVEFQGEYEWSTQGGVIHWTHRDPNQRHPGGWIRHRGQTYQ